MTGSPTRYPPQPAPAGGPPASTQLYRSSVAHRGSDGQGGPGNSAATPGPLMSSLRSAIGRASLGLLAYTRTAHSKQRRLHQPGDWPHGMQTDEDRRRENACAERQVVLPGLADMYAGGGASAASVQQRRGVCTMALTTLPCHLVANRAGLSRCCFNPLYGEVTQGIAST